MVSSVLADTVGDVEAREGLVDRNFCFIRFPISAIGRGSRGPRGSK